MARAKVSVFVGMTTTDSNRICKSLESHMSNIIKKECGAKVDVTLRGPHSWTVSGPRQDAEAATHYLLGTGMFKPDDKMSAPKVHDAESNESYYYLRDDKGMAKR